MFKQTVKDLIEYLSAYPEDMEVVFYTEPGGAPLYWLSDYEDDIGDWLCVDIGDEEC